MLALTDGSYAIALTLLELDLTMPKTPKISNAEFEAALIH